MKDNNDKIFEMHQQLLEDVANLFMEFALLTEQIPKRMGKDPIRYAEAICQKMGWTVGNGKHGMFAENVFRRFANREMGCHPLSKKIKSRFKKYTSDVASVKGARKRESAKKTKKVQAKRHHAPEPVFVPPKKAWALKAVPAYEGLKAYLATDEGKAKWQQLRFEVLRNHHGRCDLCGMGPAHGVTLHVDHIKPKSLHPELAFDPSNLQVLCEDCNLGKSNRDATDFRSKR